MLRTLRSTIALGATLLFGCDTPCPGGHDELANPIGDECSNSFECEVECVCQDGGEQIAIKVGTCAGGVCLDATDLCTDACTGGNRHWNGEFCSAGGD